MATRRYYSEDDFDVGITPSQLKRLSKIKQLPYLVWWFNNMFEDPANETPYNSQEGGYQYIWGGPYDASEELADEFGHLVSEEVIGRAVAEVESDGLLDWAPGRNHPDHERAAAEYEENFQDSIEEHTDLDEIQRRLDKGVTPSFGDAWEKSQRTKILREIRKLEQELSSTKPQHGKMGHNHPPADIQIEPVEADEIRDATRVIRDELIKGEPNVQTVANAASVFKKFLTWAAKKADLGIDEFVKSFGSSAGKAAGPVLVTVLAAKFSGVLPSITKVFSTVVEWLSHVTLPF